MLRRLNSVVLLLLMAACTSGRRPVTLALLGDISLGRGVALAHAGGDWEDALASLAPVLARADLALANLESPVQVLYGHGSAVPIQDPYNLCAPADGLTALTAAGIDLVSVANNHTDDCSPVMGEAMPRPSEIGDTAEIRRAGITPIGPGMEPVFLTIRGLRLAFLAMDDVSAPIDMEAARQVLADMRLRSDVIVVSIHWGHEYRHAPGQRQSELAAALTAAGADLVWGHHPHVLQPVETVEAGGRHALVAWSLGNALFDQVAPPAARLSQVLLVSISHEGVIETSSIPFEIDPLRCTTRLITP